MDFGLLTLSRTVKEDSIKFVTVLEYVRGTILKR
jgi:hypothetical protein